MAKQNMDVAFQTYRRAVEGLLARGHASYYRASSGHAIEHSYRPALQSLIEALGGDSVRVINEPSQIDCGAPDFIVERGGVPIGHIECKKIDTNLTSVTRTAQLKRYRAGLPNLILTDYLV